MTYYSSEDVAQVLIDGVNIAADLDTVRMKTNAVTQEFRALGTAFPQALDTGTRNGELEMSGLYEGASTAALLNAVGTNRVCSVLLEGNTVSKRFYGFQSAAVESDEIGVGVDQMHSNAGVFRVNGAVNFGYVVAPLAARTTAGTTQSTYADMGALSATCRAYLAVTSLTLGGYTNLVVTVQSCATSGGSYDDETAFTAMTAVGGQSVALSGDVNRYLAVKWAWTGAGTGQSATFFVGVAPS